MALISVRPQRLITQRRGDAWIILTKSDMPGMVSAHGEIPHHTPQVVNSNIPPSCSRFSFTIQTPNLFHLPAKIPTEDLPEPVPVIPEPSGEDDEVSLERAVVLEPQPGLGEFLEDRVILESDLSVNDHLAPPDVCTKHQGQEKIRKIETKLEGINQSNILHPCGMRAMGTQLRLGRLSS